MIYGSAVKGGISLYDLGITSVGYAENGKLKIDEDKLTEAIETKGNAIQELFTTADTGLAQQLNNIINSAAKTSGVKGTRGSLIEMAGYGLDAFNTENSIYDNITKTNKSINDLKTKLKDQETYYWNKFSALETALQQLNNQSFNSYTIFIWGISDIGIIDRKEELSCNMQMLIRAESIGSLSKGEVVVKLFEEATKQLKMAILFTEREEKT